MALAHYRAKVLRQLDCHRQVAMLGLELGDALRVCVGALHGALQHQPGRPTCGPRLWLHLHSERGCMARRLLARRQPLRLAQTLYITRHHRIVPMALEIPKQP
jgi:hypothetical protein